MGLAPHQTHPSVALRASVWEPKETACLRDPRSKCSLEATNKPLRLGYCERAKKWRHASKEERKFLDK